MTNGILGNVFSKAGAFHAYDSLSLDQLFAFSRKGKSEYISVTDYITHSFAALTTPAPKVRDDVPYSPLKLRDVLSMPIHPNEGPFQSIFVRDVICFNDRIKAAWEEKGLDPLFLPKKPVFRRVEFNQLQRFAYTFQEVDPLQDDSLELAWASMRKQLNNARDMPREGADAETIRAFLNDSVNYAKIEEITVLDLSGLALKVIPVEIERLTGLRRLLLSNNQLSEIPLYLPDSLEELELDHDQIKGIESLSNKLCELTIKYNPMKVF